MSLSDIQLPSKTLQLFIVFRYEILRNLRGKKIFGILAITVAVALFFIGIFEFVESQEMVIDSIILSIPITFVFFLTVLMGAFFGSSAIVSEFHDKTGSLLFTNPISKSSIWLGKFISSEIISIGVLLVYYLIIIGYAVSKGQIVPTEILSSISFSIVALTMVMSIAFLISSILRGPTGAAVLVFALFIIILPMVDQLLINVVDTEPWYTPTFSSGIIQNSINDPNLDSSFMAQANLLGLHVYHPDVTTSLGIMTLYIFSSGAVSLYLLRYRELK